MTTALRSHWPEYLIEGALVLVFMIAATSLTVVLEHPASAVRRAIADPLARRALMGLAMGGTAIALIYSPWGKRSGAHFNPAVTLTFWRLGRVAPWDAAFYVVAQFLGGLAGVLLVAAALREALADRAVNYAVTLPGPGGPWVAFAAEIGLSFTLMTAVLVLSNTRRLARFTGLAAGILVAAFITFEAPLSGMSMNPARTFASALPAGDIAGFWIYAIAPLLGMLLAAQGYLGTRRLPAVACAKLHHDNPARCIFRCRR